MRSFLIPALLLGVASHVTAQQEPCAQVGAAIEASPDGTFDPEIGLACLRSVPVDERGGVLQISGMKALIEFQSTLAYLKDPPPGYLYPAVDIEGGLQNISDSLEDGAYSNEFDFQTDIRTLINKAHDGHFGYSPDILNVIVFSRAEAIFSISKDGVSLPEIYGASDLSVLIQSNASNYTASPITKVNGEDVEMYLNTYTETINSQDPDANYNALFPQFNCKDTSCGNYWAGIGPYMGTETTITFKNGTSRKVVNYASSNQDMTGVTDGKVFFNKFCKGKSPVAVSSTVPLSTIAPISSGAPLSVIPSATVPPPLSTQVSYSAVPSQTAIPRSLQRPSWPKAWALAGDFSISCYFPTDIEDLMVLSVPTFEQRSQIEFQDIARQCLATANKLGKKKLVIDLRGNGGGNIFSGYDLFTQLFPSLMPWGTWNARAFPLVNDLGKIITGYFDAHEEMTRAEQYKLLYNLDMDEDIHLEDFDSWADFYGPIQTYGDAFTNLGRYNLSDTTSTDITISGYGNLTNIVPKQTFESENIVMLQDGYCGSTCTIFAEFMKMQGNVGSVAIGGRKQLGPMQAVGGVKGTNIYTFDILADALTFAYENVLKSEASELQDKYDELVPAIKHALDRVALDPEDGSHRASVNSRNNIRKGDTSITPLQFVYEAADCRIFYTAQMYLNQTYLWQATYDAYWGDGKCVEGSTNQWSSEPGVGYIEAAPGASKPAASMSASGTATGSGSVPTTTATDAASSLGISGAILALAGVVAALMAL